MHVRLYAHFNLLKYKYATLILNEFERLSSIQGAWSLVNLQSSKLWTLWTPIIMLQKIKKNYEQVS